MRTARCFLIAAACVLAACGRPDPQASAAAGAALENAASKPATRSAPPPEAPPAAPGRVAMPAPEALTDSAITGRIDKALRADPAMAGADVSINTDRGVVVLSGTVKSHEQTGVASAHAQRQDGVLRVDNHLMPALS
jgi:hyperosmotically inducible periplasmic protein